MGPGLAPGNGPTLMLDGVELPLKDNVHSLGDLLDLALRLDRQVVTVARSTSAPALTLLLCGQELAGPSTSLPYHRS